MADFTSQYEVQAVYRKRARAYDLTANLYYLVGFREHAYRRTAVAALGLVPGDTVVEIGCGTGLNFSLLQERIGPGGRIIGVDLTDALLARADERVRRNRWSNVTLVQSDAGSFEFPDRIDGILSTFALTLFPDYDAVVARGAGALRVGRRWAILDLKIPGNWLRRLAPVLVFLVRPFAVSLEITKRHPWESLDRYMTNSTMREFYFGVAYLACGEAR